jgi:hypothetical protein
MQQYISIVSPKKLGRQRVLEILKETGYELISREPLANDQYDSRDICLHLLVDYKSINDILGCKEVYRVVGPEPYKRVPIIKFINGSWRVKLDFYSRASLKTWKAFIKGYFSPQEDRV